MIRAGATPLTVNEVRQAAGLPQGTGRAQVLDAAKRIGDERAVAVAVAERRIRPEQADHWRGVLAPAGRADGAYRGARQALAELPILAPAASSVAATPAPSAEVIRRWRRASG